MNVLLTIASKHGGTDTIGERITETLRDEGITVDVREPRDVGDVTAYDAVIVGSGIYIGRWLGEARDFVTRQAAALRGRPVWLFSSGPLGEVPAPVEEPTDVPKLMELSGARDHRVFSGKLLREELGLGERAIVGVVKAPYGDYRDWSEISAWARSIAEALKAAPVA